MGLDLGAAQEKVRVAHALGTLPRQRPRKQELVLNRRTATALGLTFPASLILNADEVIE